MSSLPARRTVGESEFCSAFRRVEQLQHFSIHFTNDYKYDLIVYLVLLPVRGLIPLLLGILLARGSTLFIFLCFEFEVAVFLPGTHAIPFPLVPRHLTALRRRLGHFRQLLARDLRPEVGPRDEVCIVVCAPEQVARSQCTDLFLR